MIIQIKNLLVRTIIGINDWERKVKQDIIINIKIEFDGAKAIETDNIEDTVDYKALTKKIIHEVENSNFYLLEKLTGYILKIVMENKKISKATVKVDKPNALRFTDSVSVSCTRERKE